MDLNSFTPKQIEKVRACKSPKELFALVKEEEMEIPNELLEALAGGDAYGPDTCPKCGSTNVTIVSPDPFDPFQMGSGHCHDCGAYWDA